jgi:hypothetical protein
MPAIWALAADGCGALGGDGSAAQPASSIRLATGSRMLRCRRTHRKIMCSSPHNRQILAGVGAQVVTIY